MAVSSAYDFEKPETLEDLKRLLHIVIVDTLALENSVQRNRALADLLRVGTALLDKTELASRVEAIEEAVLSRPVQSGQRRRPWLRLS
jgi:hypothetical protein